jgi:hypothetical protein
VQIMADDDDAYGQVPEQHSYEFDVIPDPVVVSLDEPWVPPGDTKEPTPTWPTWLPPGALALAAAALALVALLGNGVASSFGYAVKFSESGTNASTTAPAHLAINVQIFLSALAILLGVAAVLVARTAVDVPAWTRDVAIAAILVGVVAAGLHWTLLQSLDNHKIPPDVVFSNSNS